MAIIANLYNSIFTFFLLPLFIVVLIGKPTFLIKLINKFLIIEEPIKKFQINTILIITFFIGIAFSVMEMTLSRSKIEKILNHKKNDHYDPKEYEEKLRIYNSNERNLYMIIACFLILITIRKFCARYLKIAEIKQEICAKKKAHPVKNLKEKKND